MSRITANTRILNAPPQRGQFAARRTRSCGVALIERIAIVCRGFASLDAGSSTRFTRLN